MSDLRGRKPEDVPERRNYTPPGRVRRIAHDHPWKAVMLILTVLLSAGAFAAASAWAVNERFTRRVTEMAYLNDTRALEFVRRREAELVKTQEQRERELAAMEEELAPRNRPYIVVSLAERRMLYLQGNDTLYKAPVAVGSGKTVVIEGRTKRFITPRGRMSITHKELDPIWVPPNWHYVEIARNSGLGIVDMSNASPNALRGFAPGRTPIRGGKVIIPPWGSPQRAIKGVLGAAKLEMYDGYYFHGTDKPSSIGTAASHGCIRMYEHDIMWMYRNVAVGTPVYIY
jgi:hypothetical protein